MLLMMGYYSSPESCRPAAFPSVERAARTAMSAVSPTESAGMTAGVESKTARSTSLAAALLLCGQATNGDGHGDGLPHPAYRTLVRPDDA